jgi:hypothetical protein
VSPLNTWLSASLLLRYLWGSGFRAAAAQRSTQAWRSARLASAMLRIPATVICNCAKHIHYRAPSWRAANILRRIRVVKTKKAYGKIQLSKFVTECMIDTVNMNKKLYDADSYFDDNAEPKREITEYEYYIGQCGFTVSHLLILLEKLLIIPGYLLEYGQTKSMKKYNINRLQDVSYHIENFIIRAKSIDDYLLQIYNAVFHLGNSPGNVNFNVIINNVHIKSTRSIDQIKKVHKLCEEYSSERNKIIHQQNILDKDQKRIELMLSMSRSESEYKTGARMQYVNLIGKYIDYKVPEMELFINELFDQIYILFESLYEVYCKRKARYSKY